MSLRLRMSHRLRMSLRLRLALSVVFVSLAVSASAGAQVGIYGMGSGGFVGATAPNAGTASGSSGFHTWGGTFGLYDDALHLGPVKLGPDGRYFQETSTNGNSYGNKLRGGLVGLRLSLKLPLFPPRPYVQAEVGGVSTNYGVDSGSTRTFAYQIQGGLDFTILPHLDLRAEYGGGQIGAIGAGKVSLQEAGLGAVLRF